MSQLVYFSSSSENTQRFIERLGLPAVRIPLNERERIQVDEPYILIVPSYGGGGGDDVKYTGKVVGLDMGTGSAFSLLPAQNATGNWIKVVQRLPVRIELDQKQLEQYPLRIGLSTLVSVNTTNRDGQVLANKVRSTPVAVSTAREISLAPVNKLIDDIVKANAG